MWPAAFRTWRLVALARALGRAYRAVILVGDAPYYGRFGFSREHTRNLSLPGPVDPARFLGLELTQGSMKPVIVRSLLLCRLHKPFGVVRLWSPGLGAQQPGSSA